MATRLGMGDFYEEWDITSIYDCSVVGSTNKYI